MMTIESTISDVDTRRPLDEVIVSVGERREVEDDDNDDASSTLSSISDCGGDDNDVALRSSPEDLKATAAPRSIFSTYWKECQLDTPPLPMRPSSPLCVMEAAATSAAVGTNASGQKQPRTRNQNYQYIYTGKNPYDHFGISREELEGYSNNNHNMNFLEDQDEGKDGGSVNTYERVLGEYESACDRPSIRPLNDRTNVNAFGVWMSFFTGNGGNSNKTTTLKLHSEPSLRDMLRHGIAGGATAVAAGRRKGVKSETDLIKTPQKSCLRRGRFSISTPDPPDIDESSVQTDQTVTNHVHFESKVKVCVFQPPVEAWAAKGWSNWFG